jgi:hypothetical protein
MNYVPDSLLMCSLVAYCKVFQGRLLLRFRHTILYTFIVCLLRHVIYIQAYTHTDVCVCVCVCLLQDDG